MTFLAFCIYVKYLHYYVLEVNLICFRLLKKTDSFSGLFVFVRSKKNRFAFGSLSKCTQKCQIKYHTIIRCFFNTTFQRHRTYNVQYQSFCLLNDDSLFDISDTNEFDQTMKTNTRLNFNCFLHFFLIITKIIRMLVSFTFLC